jgi:pyrimidine operon attenuation protein/uracil phosphoribosyltransferase
VTVHAGVDGSPRLFDEDSLQRTLIRLAHQVAERHPDLERVVLVGIKTRGAPLARRLAGVIGGLGGASPRVLTVDPGDFRDDRPRRPSGRTPLTSADGGPLPELGRATVVLVDDVLYTGRTQRAALDAVLTVGRPAAVEVLVLVDRGHREMPLRATYVGKNVPTAAGDRVVVRLREVDGADGAWLLQGAPA